jgi:nucleoside-diphosphate-sugar epimerase
MESPGQPDIGSVLVTGVSGNLGSRVLLQLSNRRVVGADLYAPVSAPNLTRFESMDLGDEASCDQLVRMLREENVRVVVHLAFVIDPVRTGILDVDRMWQVNVAGTARVMEAIAEVNRHGGNVSKFIFVSSVSAYGPETPGPVTEDYPLAAHTLPYAVHKKEADETVRARANRLGNCSTFILRPHIFAGATMQNYLIGALRGTPPARANSPRTCVRAEPDFPSFSHLGSATWIVDFSSFTLMTSPASSPTSFGSLLPYPSAS